MLDDLSVVVNTHSSASDVWPIFFRQLEKHFINQAGNKSFDGEIYVFTDDNEEINGSYQSVVYDKADSFTKQYLQCLNSVKSDFILYLNEDYLLYDDVDLQKLDDYLGILKNIENLAFVRLTRGPNFTKNRINDDLFYLSHEQPFFYSQTAAIWKKDALAQIHKNGPDAGIGASGVIDGHFEVAANQVCKDLKLQGVVAYNQEPLRGEHHYDCQSFPYIASAVVKGAWNLKEYSKELLPLLRDHKINPQERGWI